MGDRQQYQGTPEYMAPELLRGGTGVFTGQSDVYSLGVMMGQIFSGEKPYPDAQGIADIRSTRRIDNSPVFSEHTDKELNRLTEGLYQRMLDKDPNKRPTVQDLRREFAMDPGAVSYARGKLLALIQAANRH
jgi:serine/threonine protein kinase